LQQLSVYRDKSGYNGADIAEYGQPVEWLRSIRKGDSRSISTATGE